MSNEGMFKYEETKYGLTLIQCAKADDVKEAVIPNTVNGETVQAIGDLAFYKCKNLESIVISEGIKYIGLGAFALCEHLKTITLPGSLKSIGFPCQSSYSDKLMEQNNDEELGNDLDGSEGVFQSCGLEEITIPKNVNHIESCSFFDCQNLKEVVLPENLKTIESSLFWGCGLLKDITLPNSLQKIEGYAFEGCASLNAIRIPDTVTYIGPKAFDKNSSDLTFFCKENSYAWQYAMKNDIHALENEVVPMPVKERHETRRNESEEHYTDPDIVDKIIDRYRSGMTEYENKEMFCRIQFDSSDDVAYYRTDLAEAHFLKIGTPVTINFVTEGEILTGKIASIKDYFTYPAPFPDKGVLIADRKEADWVKKPYLYVHTDGGISILRFNNYNGDKEIIIPDSIDGEKVVSIGKHAFESCKGLRRVVIPEGVGELCENAFKDCYFLEEIVLPDQMRKIGKNCFAGCNWLSEIKLPESLTYIDYDVFADCWCLEKIYIPDSVTNIFPDAFKESTPVFFCSSNSYAAKYAEKNKISHIKSEYYQKISQHEWNSDNLAILTEEDQMSDEIVNVHAIDITLVKNEEQKPDSEKPKSQKIIQESRPVKNNASEKEKILKNHIEIMDETFSKFGLQVLQVSGVNYKKSHSLGEEIEFYIELKSLSEMEVPSRLYLKVNVYDNENDLIERGTSILSMEDFAGYDTVEVHVKRSGIHEKAAKAKVYITKSN